MAISPSAPGEGQTCKSGGHLHQPARKAFSSPWPYVRDLRIGVPEPLHELSLLDRPGVGLVYLGYFHRQWYTSSTVRLVRVIRLFMVLYALEGPCKKVCELTSFRLVCILLQIIASLGLVQSFFLVRACSRLIYCSTFLSFPLPLAMCNL